MENNLEEYSIISNYFTRLREALTEMPISSIVQVIKVLNLARDNRRTVYLFGNGGSAATASHCACDLSKGCTRIGVSGIKAVALTDHLPLITAWANDESYDQIYARQLENFIEQNDLAIGISVSGNSPNVLNGIKMASSKGAVTIAFTSADGGSLKDIVDIAVKVPVNNMEQAEDLHLIIEHVMALCLRSGSTEFISILADLERNRVIN